MMGKQKREALRLAIYIALLGESPVLFYLRNWRRCVADLRRQYQSVKDNVDANKAHQSLLEGRRLIRVHGLLESAQSILPESFEIALTLDREGLAGLEKRRELLLSSLRRLITQPSNREDSSNDHRLTSNERSNCRRKLRHRDIASATRHAMSLDDSDIIIYTCRACSGLHVGHHPITAKLKKISSKLTTIAVELAPIERMRAQLLNQRKMLLEQQTKLKAILRLEADGESL